MTKWAGRALIAAGMAGMVYGVYLLTGKGWAIVVGSFVVYVAGFHLTTSRRAGAAQVRHDEAAARVSESMKRQQKERERWMN